MGLASPTKELKMERNEIVELLKETLNSWIKTAKRNSYCAVPCDNASVIITGKALKEEPYVKELPRTRKEVYLNFYMDMFDVTLSEVNQEVQEEYKNSCSEEDYETFFTTYLKKQLDIEDNDGFLCQDDYNSLDDNDLLYHGYGFINPVKDAEDILLILTGSYTVDDIPTSILEDLVEDLNKESKFTLLSWEGKRNDN